MKNSVLASVVVAAASMFLFDGSGWASSARVSIPVEKHDFGEVKQGPAIRYAFSVRNEGDSPLEFPSAELSMPGMRVSLPSVIAPGAEGEIIVQWDSKVFAGEAEGVAIVKTNDPARPVISLSLTGKVIPPISVDPIPGVFMSVFEDTKAERVLTIRNNEDAPLRIMGIVPNPLVETSLEEVEKGRTFKLRVRSVPGTPVGRYESAIELSTDSPARKTMKLGLFLWVKRDLYANPESLDFGTVSAVSFDPEASGQTVFVKKKEGTFAIRSITSDSPLLALEVSPGEPSQTFRVDVTLRPSGGQQGPRKATIRIETDDPEIRFVEVPVTVTIQ